MKLTLSQRLSLVFAVLLLACCGASGWVQMRAADRLGQEVVQRLSLGLADSIASHAGLTDQKGLDAARLPALFNMLMVVNPSVEVYLLGEDGQIKAFSAPEGHLKRKQVDMAPIRRLLAGETLPIPGDDPRSLDARKVFSVAPLRADGRAMGYVYVVLQGESFDAVSADLGASQTLRIALWSLAIVTLLGLLAGLVAFRSITRPLRALTRDVSSVGLEGGQAIETLAATPPVSSGERDEISLLRQAFGTLAARITQQWRELLRQDQQRRDLLTNISHDLRTPLTSLHGYLETLSVKSDSLSPADRQRYLQTALGQSRKVGRLAQELFELARLEHGGVKPEKEVFSLAELVQDVFQKFELAAEARHLSLHADFAPQLPSVTADLGMIERVLTNLLDNAIRHTPDGGEVHVGLTHVDGRIDIQVADKGPGIPAELRSGLFTRPSSPTRTTQGGGGGFGLMIVHRILRLHDSEIRLLDRAGWGAVFSFGLATADRSRG